MRDILVETFLTLVTPFAPIIDILGFLRHYRIRLLPFSCYMPCSPSVQGSVHLEVRTQGPYQRSLQEGKSLVRCRLRTRSDPTHPVNAILGLYWEGRRYLSTPAVLFG